MSIVGPRPQLVRDMVFMTSEQRKRHDVRPGLSGLAQVNGRNDIDWEDKLNWDLKYIQKITFLGDIKIILQTVLKGFVKQEGITEGDMATAEDFGDYLLSTFLYVQFSVESIGVNFHAYKDKSNKFKITACMTKLLCENND